MDVVIPTPRSIIFSIICRWFEIHECCMITFSFTFSLALHSLAYEEVHALALDQVLAPERKSNEK